MRRWKAERSAVDAALEKPIILAIADTPGSIEVQRTLKFQPDRAEGVNVITRHDASSLWVGAVGFEHSVLVPWQGAVLHWSPASIEGLDESHFEQVLALHPELVIFGSGARLRFIAPKLMRCLIDRRIGVETMDTAAACRTYNVLAAEGRLVVGALLLDGAETRSE